MNVKDLGKQTGVPHSRGRRLSIVKMSFSPGCIYKFRVISIKKAQWAFLRERHVDSKIHIKRILNKVGGLTLPDFFFPLILKVNLKLKYDVDLN